MQNDFDLFERFVQVIDTYVATGRNTKKILLAVSGGVDSIVMLDLFDRLKSLKSDWRIDIGVATFNHKLREEAYSEVEFVRQVCESRNLTFYTSSGDVAKFAQSNKYSTEEAARFLRYSFLNEIAQKNGYNYISTAHNANDLLETILLRFAKGTGPFGLAGIKPAHDQYIRPLIFFSREEIEKYAQSRKLHYVVDKSNFDVKYQRNFIRHEIVPLLKSINPSLERSALHLSKNIWKMDEYIDRVLASSQINMTNLEDRIIFKLVEDKYLQTEQIRRMALKFFKRPLDMEKLERFETCDSQSFKVSFWRNLGIEVSYNWVMMGPIDNYLRKSIKLMPCYSGFDGNNTNNFEYEFNGYFIKINFGGIINSRFSGDIEIRNWIEGDRLTDGRKIKDLFNSKKVPTFVRKLMPLVVFDNRIIFAPYLYEDKKTLKSIDIEVQVKGGLCFES
ncbi:MAG TPA: tRNA lysidine(34) synthetase TilS [Fervidobacterium sp.]|nr:tRNA lysidine(34) synthetase TilS [Fervidobacterium sp.]HPT58418.1 tRNA lysidine(34) synthetase TilS [Fervidobacterium sp.]